MSDYSTCIILSDPCMLTSAFPLYKYPRTPNGRRSMCWDRMKSIPSTLTPISIHVDPASQKEILPTVQSFSVHHGLNFDTAPYSYASNHA